MNTVSCNANSQTAPASAELGTAQLQLVSTILMFIDVISNDILSDYNSSSLF